MSLFIECPSLDYRDHSINRLASGLELGRHDYHECAISCITGLLLRVWNKESARSERAVIMRLASDGRMFQMIVVDDHDIKQRKYVITNGKGKVLSIDFFAGQDPFYTKPPININYMIKLMQIFKIQKQIRY